MPGTHPKHRAIAALAVALVVIPLIAGRAAGAPPARPAPAYTLLTSDRIGGPGGWDYLALDATGRRLYITRSDHVDVYDTEAAKVVGQVPGTAGVHGVALDPGRARGYTSNGRAGTVTVFDTATLKAIREVPVGGENPDAILYDPAGDKVYTFNGKSRDASVIDAATLEVVAHIALPGKPEFAATDGAGRIYVNIETEPGQLVVIDGATRTVRATWPLAGCDSPTGLALDAAHRRLFSVCDGSVMAVTDAQTGRAVARVKIGEGPDAAAYDPALGLVFSSNGDGTLSIVRQESPDRYVVAQTLATQRGARTMALDPRSHRVYLVTSDFGPAPAATAESPHPRPIQVPDTFTLHVAGTR